MRAAASARGGSRRSRKCGRAAGSWRRENIHQFMTKKKATRALQASSPRGRRHPLRWCCCCRRLARCSGPAAGELAAASSGSGGGAASGIPALDLDLDEPGGFDEQAERSGSSDPAIAVGLV